jgi:hypothetical protein
MLVLEIRNKLMMIVAVVVTLMMLLLAPLIDFILFILSSCISDPKLLYEINLISPTGEIHFCVLVYYSVF